MREWSSLVWSNQVFVAAVLLLCIMTRTSPALATINFIGGSLTGAGGGNSSNGAGRGDNMAIPCDGTMAPMNVPRPTGTIPGDAMVAQFIVRPQGTDITSPPGWTMMRRSVQVSGGNNTPPYGLDIISYFRVLKVGETDTNYTWYISYDYPTCPPVGGAPASEPTMAIGGILAFRGSFPIAPVYFSGEDPVNNGSSTTHVAPSISVGVPNTMTVAGIGFLSAEPFGTGAPSCPASTTTGPCRTAGVEATQPTVGLNQWSGPSGTRVNTAVGLSLQMSYFGMSAAGDTGAVTAVGLADADNGVGHMVSITEILPPVDMALTKSANSGATEYYLTVANKATSTGTQPAGSVIITDTLPPQQNYVGFSGTNWSCVNALQTVTCTYLPALPPGATAPTVTIKTANSGSAVVCNTAIATGAFGDGNNSDNTATSCDQIGGAVAYSGKVYLDANQNNIWDSGETGIGQTNYVKITNRTGSTCTGPALEAIPTDSASGAYSFSVAPGNYCLILDDNNLLSDITPTLPASYIAVEQPTGINTSFTAVAGTPQTGLNFGLFQPLYVKVNKTLIPSTDTGRFNLSISGGSPSGGANPANNVGDTGTTGYVNVARGSTITVQETGGTIPVTNLANYITTLSCVTDTGTTLIDNVTLTGTPRSSSFIAPASGTAGYVTCTFTNSLATLTINKVTIGGTGGTFNFTATNPAIAATGIPVTATNTPTTVPALTNVLIPSLSTATTITEAAPPGGYTLSAASCVDNATGSTIASSVNLGTRILTINANTIPAGTNVVCTFTNTASTADDHGDAPASYGDASHRTPSTVYLGTTAPTNDNANYLPWQGQTTATGDDADGTADEGIAQLLSGAPASFPAWGAATYSMTLVCRGNNQANRVNGWIDFNHNGMFDINERAQGTCSSNNATAGTVILTWSTFPADLQTGPTYARFRFSGTLAASSVPTGNSANTGEVEDYPITLSRPPQLKVVKAIDGRLAATDQFTVRIRYGAGPTTAVTATTASPATTVTTAQYNATAGTTYTFQEIASGTTVLANYNTTYICTNVRTGGSVVASGTATSFTLVPVADDDITCTFVNKPKPTLQLLKTWLAGSTPPNAITATTTGGSTNATIISTATAIGNTTTGTAVFVTPGNVITLPAETFTNGSQANYSTTVSCTGNSNPLAGSAPPQTLTVDATDTAIVCTYTNTPKRLTLQKIIGARIAAADQFTLNITGTNSNSATTAGVATGLQTQYATVIGAGNYTIGEVMAAGSSSILSQYTTTVSCINNTAGGTNVSGVNALGALPALLASDAVTCTIINTPKTLTLRKSITARINAADQFDLNITGAGTNTATTSGAATGLQAQTASYTGAGIYTIGESMAAGSVSSLSQYTSTVACTNTATVGTPTSVAGVTTLGTLPNLKVGDAVTCTITNTPKTLVLQKNITSRINSADQFKLDITGTAASTATTAGATTGVQTATVASVTGAGTYTIAESMAAGSVSALSQYTIAVACTNAKSGGTNVTGVTTLTTLPALTATDGVSCTITNNVYPSLTLVKSVQTYSDPVNNTTTPKAIPGAVMLYSMQLVNSGAGTVDTDKVVLTDLIPANTVMCVTSACNNLNPPLTYSCSATPACGLTFNAATDVSYSYQPGGGPPYVYPPTSPDGAGFDANVKEVRINPKGVFNAASGGNNATFNLTFKVMVK